MYSLCSRSILLPDDTNPTSGTNITSGGRVELSVRPELLYLWVRPVEPNKPCSGLMLVAGPFAIAGRSLCAPLTEQGSSILNLGPG